MKQSELVDQQQNIHNCNSQIQLLEGLSKPIKEMRLSQEVWKTFLQYELKFLEERIVEIGQINHQNSQISLLKNEVFKEELQLYIQEFKKNDEKDNQHLISLIQNFFVNKINQVEINQIIEEWQRIRDSHLAIQRILNEDLLDSLIQIPEILNIISTVSHIHKPQNQYDFYDFLVKEIIEINKNRQLYQQIEDREYPENVFDNLELFSIKFIINQKLTKENFSFQLKSWVDPLLKQKQIINFLIARHFNKWLQKISSDSTTEFQNEIDVFVAIKNQSNIALINFTNEDLIDSVNYLKEKYQYADCSKIRLIKMIKASAFLTDFEQEAGNAMTLLSSLQSIIRNENLSKIKLKNSTMNNIAFFQTDFRESKMDNVSIVSAQFIECQLENVCWKNLESSCLNILRKQTIFSTHSLILISMEVDKGAISFWNYLIGKYIKKFLCKNFESRIKKTLKLSCLGQVLLLNNRYLSCFWSVQCNKKIRVNKIRKNEMIKKVFSHDFSILATYKKRSYGVSLWKIYQNQQNLVIPQIKIYKAKFSKDGRILSVLGKFHQPRGDYSFWDVQNGQEIQSIQKGGCIYIFEPNGKYYVIKQDKEGLLMKKIDDQNYKQKLTDTHNPYPKYYLQTLELQSHNKSQKQKFSPDGQILAFNHNSDVVLWTFNKGQKIHILNGVFDIKNIEFSQDGQHFPKILESIQFSDSASKLGFIYKALTNCIITIKNLNDMNAIYEENFELKGKIQAISLSSDLSMIAFCNNPSTIFIKKLREQNTIIILSYTSVHPTGVKLRFSPSGEYLIVFTESQFLQNLLNLSIWRIKDIEKIYELNISEASLSNIKQFEFSPYTQQIVILGFLQVKIVNFNEQSAKVLESQIDYRPKILAYCLHNRFLAFDYKEDESSGIRIWDIDKDNLIQQLNCEVGQIIQIMFLNDDILISASLEGRIQFWNFSEGRKIQEINLKKIEISNFSISFDRQMLLTKCTSGSVYLFRKIEIDKNNKQTIDKTSNLDIEEGFHYTLYWIFDNHNFRCVNCSLDNSSFSSTEGVNLQTIFQEKC